MRQVLQAYMHDETFEEMFEFSQLNFQWHNLSKLYGTLSGNKKHYREYI